LGGSGCWSPGLSLRLQQRLATHGRDRAGGAHRTAASVSRETGGTDSATAAWAVASDGAALSLGVAAAAGAAGGGGMLAGGAAGWAASVSG